MRKFIFGDLHGNGDVYDSLMGYLENVSRKESVDLSINGDLFDCGPDSFRMLMDMKDRMKMKDRMHIHYYAGNHEWLMYGALIDREPGKWIDPFCNWMMNGGWLVEGEMDAREDGEELCEEFKGFLSELKIYHLFDEKIAGKPMVLVHAQVPEHVQKECDMKLGDSTLEVERAVWTRKDRDYFGLFGQAAPAKNRIGSKDYFSIVGHTPVANGKGFAIDEEENTINIDGDCALYALGKFEYDRVPLVEVHPDHIDIIIFNHDNEIVDGYHYNGELTSMGEEEINQHRKFINHDFDHQAEAHKQKICEIINV